MSNTKLTKDVEQLIKWIFDPTVMSNNMKKLGYDDKKMPLGKLSKQSIQKGYEALNKIDKALDKKNNHAELLNLSSEFFTYIPHNFGFQQMSQFVINTKAMVKEKVEMLESLEDMKIANKINEEVASTDDADLTAKYDRLKCEIRSVPTSSNAYKKIEEFTKNSYDHDHGHQKLKILDLFEVERHGEDAKYTKNLPKKFLLWHGSRVSNFVGILSQGLRIAPPEAPLTDAGWFGKGAYFADMVSVSTDYCHTYLTDNTGLLLICEVAMGKWQECLQITPSASNLPKGINSTKALGTRGPSADSFKTFEGDVELPLGKVIDTKAKSSLYHNEYVVYNTNQCKLRYVLKFKLD